MGNDGRIHGSLLLQRSRCTVGPRPSWIQILALLFTKCITLSNFIWKSHLQREIFYHSVNNHNSPTARADSNQSRSIQVSHMSGKDSSTWDVICWPLRCTWAGSWIRNRDGAAQLATQPLHQTPTRFNNLISPNNKMLPITCMSFEWLWFLKKIFSLMIKILI